MAAVAASLETALSAAASAIATSVGGEASGLKHHADRHPNPRVDRIVKVVIVVHEGDVDVVGVLPCRWPRLHESEGVAAILEAGIAMNQYWRADAKPVFRAEVSPIAPFGDAPTRVRAEAQGWAPRAGVPRRGAC